MSQLSIRVLSYNLKHQWTISKLSCNTISLSKLYFLKCQWKRRKYKHYIALLKILRFQFQCMVVFDVGEKYPWFFIKWYIWNSDWSWHCSSAWNSRVCHSPQTSITETVFTEMIFFWRHTGWDSNFIDMKSDIHSWTWITCLL